MPCGRWRCPALWVLLLALPSVGFCHRLDEYLQATLVVIESRTIRLQINLVPGVTVADEVIAAIDLDHDGIVSAEEAAAYGERLKRDLSVRLDRNPLELTVAASTFPARVELREGKGIIELEYAVKVPTLKAGMHTLSIENRHQAAASVYLLNAALPTSGAALRISAQRRNQNQSSGEIDFMVN